MPRNTSARPAPHAPSTTAQLLQQIQQTEQDLESASAQSDHAALVIIAVSLCKQYNDAALKLLDAGAHSVAHEHLTQALAMVQPGGQLASAVNMPSNGATSGTKLGRTAFCKRIR